MIMVLLEMKDSIINRWNIPDLIKNNQKFKSLLVI